MDPDTGTISGTPAAGPKSVTITLNDALGDNPATPVTYTLTIDPLPTITARVPARVGQGAISQNVVINGTGFVNGAALDSSFSGSGITVNSTDLQQRDLGDREHHDRGGCCHWRSRRDGHQRRHGRGHRRTGKFTVNAKPTVTSANPGSRGQGVASQNIVITGTGFVSGAGLGHLVLESRHHRELHHLQQLDFGHGERHHCRRCHDGSE